MTPTAQAPGVLDVSRQPLTKQQILKPDGEYGKALAGLIQTKIRAESDPEQSKVYAKIRRNNLYYRGMQFLTMVRLPDGGMDYRPVASGGMTPVSQSDSRDEMYDNILPLFRGDVRKWCGVLGVRSPNAKCEPRTVGDDHQIRLSRIGDRAISYLKNSWKADDLQRYLAYSLAVNGTTFGYVNFVASETKYGATEIPRREVVQVPNGEPMFVCANCGTENPVMQTQQAGRCMQCEFPLGPEDYREPELVPGVIQTGVERYANGAVEVQLASGATVKTPYYISDVEHCPWIWYEYLVNRYELIRTYAPQPKQGDQSPEAKFRRELREHLLSDRTTDGSGGASTGEVRRTLNTLSSPTGMPFERKSLGSFGQYFLSPGMMEALSDEDDRSGNLREQLLANYPKGAHLIYLSGKLADFRHVALAERWSVCQPDTGDFIYRDAVFDDYIQGTDVVNDMLNIVIQQAEKSNPLTFFDPDIVDPDYLRNRQVQTGEMLEAKRGVGSQLSTSFFRIPPSELNESLIKFMEFYIQKNRENVGIMPAIYGGGEADEAVGVAKIRRNQSLMQLNVPWNYMRDFWSTTYSNAIRLLAQYSNGKLITNKGGTIEIEELDGIAELSQGGIKIETEEAMPMTWAQRQEQVESMLSRPPQAWPLLGLTDPMGNPLPANVERMQDAVGLPDWQVPGLAAKERLLDIIGQLLKGEPIDPPPMPQQFDAMGIPLMPGPPPPPQPSIAPNTTMFGNPNLPVQVLQDWLVGDKGRDAENGAIPGQSPRGFENVLAYTQAWIMIANPPMPLPTEEPSGPEGGDKPADGPPPPDQKQLAGPPPPGQAGMTAPPANPMPTGPPQGTIQ